MKSIRVLLEPPPHARRLLATILMAVALIAGLLAMHTLTSDHGAGHAAEHLHSAAGMGEGVALAVPGDVPEQPPHEAMAASICVLALIAGVLLLMEPTRRSGHLRELAIRQDTRVGAAVVARPHPPSLTLLSISRT